MKKVGDDVLNTTNETQQTQKENESKQRIENEECGAEREEEYEFGRGHGELQ